MHARKAKIGRHPPSTWVAFPYIVFVRNCEASDRSIRRSHNCRIVVDVAKTSRKSVKFG